ncbi:transporter substrate-binding domain-containing protein [Gordonia sp. ABSL11-1]|uniref:transporter substrate-binding domain-containing protein n=1 Tax=Gordonia sp. ABSL11-1 TaxID=3053924 RepID=UPI0025735EA7|nr:transporter substrate-binding domain-containing protein [Gordonia sp. ABSL11-1]MDL9947131.1 transporter substrate-binding domain-containing protein [Gordonia sp. ABSL11-1]
MFRHPLARPLAVAATVITVVTLAACGSSDATTDEATTAIPTQDVVSSVTADPAIRNELPAEIRAAGTLTVGTPPQPGTSQLPHGGKVDGKDVGLDVDLRNAVAKVLGVRLTVENGTFATILPGVENGKYQVGQANFGATRAREQVVDFATYLNDGQGFLAASDVDLDKATSITDVCGYTIATTPGSTFQTLLSSQVGKCAAAGKKPWTVQYFADTAPIFLGLANGKVDIYFGPTLSLKYDERHIEGTKFLGQISSTPVGFVTAKGSPLAPALSDAVNKLIETGDYAKIFAKWDVPDTKIDRSVVNPPTTF